MECTVYPTKQTNRQVLEWLILYKVILIQVYNTHSCSSFSDSASNVYVLVSVCIVRVCVLCVLWRCVYCEGVCIVRACVL